MRQQHHLAVLLLVTAATSTCSWLSFCQAFLLPPPSSSPTLTRSIRPLHATTTTTTSTTITTVLDEWFTSTSSTSTSSSTSSSSTAAAELISLLEEASSLTSSDPAQALTEGRWFKLICGASYQDLPRVKALALVYTLAGVDCIDMSASEAVVTAVSEGVDAALALGQRLLGRPLRQGRPWLMVSVNDQEDLHFRKASFDPAKCPSDCPRPCETICPTSAIPPLASLTSAAIVDGTPSTEGVAHQGRCYGCGRCLSVCPLGLIEAKPYQVDAASVLMALTGKVDALEIHTNASSFHEGQQAAFAPGSTTDPFEDLCRHIQAPASQLQAISVSFPFMGEKETGSFLESRNSLLQQYFRPRRDEEEENVNVNVKRKEKEEEGRMLNIWQTDGRPMSGDIGKGTTLSAVKFGEVVLQSRALPWVDRESTKEPKQQQQHREMHFLQLAGGTNGYTAEKLAAQGLLSPSFSVSEKKNEGEHQQQQQQQWVHGLAFGGFARMEVDRVMTEYGLGPEASLLEAPPQVLLEVVRAALAVVRPIKRR